MSERLLHPHQEDGSEKPERIKSILSVENGENIEMLTFAPGDYGFDFGFREIDPNAKDWFHGGSDKDIRESRAFELNVHSPEFRQLAKEFRSRNIGFADPARFIIALDSVIQKSIASDMEDERCVRVSDIVKLGKGACASKVLIAGLLAKEIGSLAAETVNGQVGRVRERVSHPFSHEWLRLTDGDRVALYDPMYGRFQFFSRQGQSYEEVKGGNYDFGNYSVKAFPHQVIFAKGMNAKAVQGIRLVDSFDGPTKEFFVLDQFARSSQIEGGMYGVFVEGSGVVKLYDGYVWGGFPYARIKYPLRIVDDHNG